MSYGHQACRVLARLSLAPSRGRVLAPNFKQQHVPGPCSRARCYSTVHASALTFGQPLYETHPHLLQPGELTPGITAQEYADRRTRLAAALPTGSIAIVAAADTVQRTGSCFYEFHQDPDFLYLTGYNEPEALAVIGKDSTGTDHTFHLYVRGKDAKAEMWDGARSGIQAARDVFNADEAGDIARIKEILPKVVSSVGTVFTDITQPDTTTSGLRRFLYGSKARRNTDFAELVDAKKVKQLRYMMNDLRAYKSQAELGIMRQAGRASGLAHNEAMKRTWTNERELDAFLRWRFIANGCDTLAYESVVAGGKHGLGIHYVRNDDMLLDDEMVLIDAGGKKAGYITDITRTWPNGKKFSAAQKDLYQAVLNVQKTMISLCRGDANMSLDKLHSVAEKQLEAQLKQLGFDLSGKAVETLFPHHISHYIGMDVHDCVGYSRKAVVREGHCITIEPGVYIPDDARWPKHFRNMAIRIEDSISVGEEAPFILTSEAIKEIKEIEDLRSG